MSKRPALALVATFLFACGARTGLDVGEGMDGGWRWPDAGPDAGRDATPPPLDGARDAAPPPRDAGVDAPACVIDGDCADDDIPCTDVRCIDGACIGIPDDARCPPSTFCGGDTRCEPAVGCIATGGPCNDGIECTEDRCIEEGMRCEFIPRADRCPVSRRCDPERGCLPRIIIHDQEQLFEIDVPSGELTPGPLTGVAFTDVALASDGTVYAVTVDALYQANMDSGRITRIAGGIAARMVALEFGPDGLLYTAADSRIIRFDRTGGGVTLLNRLPGGLQASGDVVFVDGRLLVTANTLGPVGDDRLVEVPLDGRTPRDLGSTGARCVWGMAVVEGRLYGFSCAGYFLEMDPLTGAGSSTTDLPGALRVWGAASR